MSSAVLAGRAVDKSTIERWQGASEPAHSGGAPQWATALQPESQLGFQVAAMTLPKKVAPTGDHTTEDVTFLLPYSVGEIESSLSTPMKALPLSVRCGYALLPGAARDHTQMSAAVADLKRNCGLSEATVEKVLRGPGGVGPIDWCRHHGITQPLSNAAIRHHYYRHFGIGITNPEGSVHNKSIYWRSYGMWTESQVAEFIEGVEITPTPMNIGHDASSQPTAVSVAASTAGTEPPPNEAENAEGGELAIEEESLEEPFSEGASDALESQAQEEAVADSEDYSLWLTSEALPAEAVDAEEGECNTGMGSQQAPPAGGASEAHESLQGASEPVHSGGEPQWATALRLESQLGFHGCRYDTTEKGGTRG
jgi:hypothetical protein